MRIGIYASYLGRPVKTGVEVYAEEVVSRIVGNQGHEFVLFGSLTRQAPFDSPNVKHVSLLTRGKVAPLVYELRTLATREGVDSFFFPAQYTWVGRRQSNVCVGYDVAWRYFPDYFPAPKRIAFEALSRNMVNRAGKILAISEATRNDLIGSFGCPSDKVETVLLGYDKKLYSSDPHPRDAAVLAAFGLEKGGYSLFLGTLQKRKNVINLLRAFTRSSSGLPLVLAGGKGWYYDEIKSEIAAAAKVKKVVELGYVSEADKPALYRGCASFFYPSLYEGFGLPVLEAMACGCKVVTSNVSSLPEVAGDGALCVDPNDVQAIAEAIDFCESSGADSMRERAIARAACFSWDATATATLKAIEGAVRGR
jgi:glycosyltransferase involved in cell wall biosynthesis